MARDSRGRFVGSGGGVSGVSAEDAGGLKKVTEAANEAGDALEKVEEKGKKASFALSLIDKVNAPTRKANEGLLKLFGSVKDAAAGSDKLAGKVKNVAGVLGKEALTSFAGWAGKAVPAESAMGRITAVLSEMGPKGQMAAAALTVLTAVITAAASKLWEWAAAAVASAQKRDALIATFNALGEGANAGEKTLAAIGKLAKELPFATGQITAWAKSLMAAGIQGKAMERAVRAVAAATAIMGEEGGAAAEGLIKRFAMAEEAGQKIKLDRRMLNQLANAGVSVAALANALGVPAEKLGSMSLDAEKLGEAMQTALIQKGAGALEAMSLTWDSISTKLKEGVGSIFAGMGDAVRPMMVEIKSFFSEFFKGSAGLTLTSGLMKAILVPVFHLATKAVHALHLAYLQVAIASLKVIIFLAPLIKWLQKLMTNATVVRGLLIALAIPIGLVALALTLTLIPLAVLVALFAVVVVAIGLLVSGFLWLVGVIYDFAGAALGALAGWATGAWEAAKSFIMGLVNGITSGAGAVYDAVKGLASGAVAALMGALKAHSPSRLTMGIGTDVFAAGMGVGVDQGTARVEKSAQRLGGEAVAALETGASRPAAGAQGARAGGSMVFNFAPGSIVIHGAGKGAEELTEELFATVLERMAGQMFLLRAT